MKRLLLLLVLAVVSAAGPVTFSGSASLDGEQEFIGNVQGDTLRSPYSQLTFSLNPTLTVYGFPISFNFLLSSMEDNLKQALNKYRMYLDPEYLLQSSLNLSWLAPSIKGVEVGSCNPSWSDLTLSGASVLGGAVEFNPWYIYTAAAVGRTQRAVEPSDTTDAAFSQMLYAVKLGGGKKEGTHFYLTGMYASDDSGSLTNVLQPSGPPDTIIENGDTTIVQDSLDVVTPEENYVLGAELNLSFWDGALGLLSEAAVSEFTRDNRMEVMEYDWLPGWVSSTFKPRLSSSIDFAYRVKPTLNVLDTRLYGEVSMVGPGYRSLGAPNLRNDYLAFGGGISRSFIDNQVSASAAFTRERDNISVANDSLGNPIQTKGLTTWFTSYSFDLGLAFTGIPYLQLGYYPYTQENDSTKDQTQMFTAGAGYDFMTGTLSHSPGVSFSYQKTTSTTEGASGTVFDVGLFHSVGFEIPLSLSAGFGFGQQNYPDTTGDQIENNYFADVTPSYTLFGVWSNSLTLGWASDAGGNSYDVRLSSSFPIWKIADANVGVEQSFFRGSDSLSSSYDDLRLTAGLSKSW
ncbi:MAG: hypothetical protein JSU73_09110 [candidate division WOR-3 bacterium]|nr:MAG: hypothetical protein JSU73_09110 [candidate division WOR-3 bacterium]